MLTKIEKAVRKAGQHLLKGFNSSKDISFKGKVDLVTQYDVEVEKILFEELSFMSSEYGFVAEETSREKSQKKKAVYIDPIDGTTNFVHGFPFCCVSVGVYEENEGEYGIVYNPILDEMYTAESGGGAFLNGERIHTSKTDKIEHALVATGFSCSDDVEVDKETLEVLHMILSSTRGIRRAGSAALDLCQVAKGVFDVYYESNLNPWDIAAGALIAKEAGADVFGSNFGQNADLYEKFIFASTPRISSELFDIIKR